jgi:hypothetical protein
MALNPATLHELETHGMTNAALGQLLAMVREHVNGSVTWHISQGELIKFEVRHLGSLKNLREVEKVTKRIKA